jgi:hypothetical protein
LSTVVSGDGCVVAGIAAVDGGRGDVEVVPAVVGTAAVGTDADVGAIDVEAPAASAAAPTDTFGVTSADDAEISATAIDVIVSAATGRVGDQTTASFTELGDVCTNALVVAITATPQAMAAAPTAARAKCERPTPPGRATSGSSGVPIWTLIRPDSTDIEITFFLVEGPSGIGRRY